MSITILTKAPTATKYYAIDFTADLSSGDTIASLTSIDHTPNGLTITGTGFTDSTATFTAAGGVDETTYLLTATVVTTNGETLVGYGMLAVVAADSGTTTQYSTLRVTYDTLSAAVEYYLGYSGTLTTSQTSRVNAAIESGLRRFYWPPIPEGQPPFEWSFLRKPGTLSLTSGTGTYDLPTDLAIVIPHPTILTIGRIELIDPELMRALNAGNAQSGSPVYCAVQAKTQDSSTGTRYELVCRPTPDDTFTMAFNYVCEPWLVSGGDPYPLGGAIHAETLLEACLAAAEATVNDSKHVHEDRFQACLAASMRAELGARYALSS